MFIFITVQSIFGLLISLWYRFYWISSFINLYQLVSSENSLPSGDTQSQHFFSPLTSSYLASTIHLNFPKKQLCTDLDLARWKRYRYSEFTDHTNVETIQTLPTLHWLCYHGNFHQKNWLVVSTPLTNISHLGWLFPIYRKLKHVPNHQPANKCF